jgi:hypothetical protein
VAGYSATGQVTSERRRKPFQFARGAMDAVLQTGTVRTQDERGSLVPTLRNAFTVNVLASEPGAQKRPD